MTRQRTKKRSSASYTRERRILDLVLDRKRATRLDFDRYGIAVRFRQTCYEFRARYKEELQHSHEEALTKNLGNMEIDPEGSLFADMLECPDSEYDFVTIQVEQDPKYAQPDGRPDKNKPAYMIIWPGAGPAAKTNIIKITDVETGEDVEV